MIHECLIRQNIAKKKFDFFFKNYKCPMQNLRIFFQKKKSWSQMIPNRLIRREMQIKKKLVAAEIGGGGGPTAVFYERYQNLG